MWSTLFYKSILFLFAKSFFIEEKGEGEDKNVQVKSVNIYFVILFMKKKCNLFNMLIKNLPGLD